MTRLALRDPCESNLLLLPGLKLILNNPFGGLLVIHSYSIETETTDSMEKHCLIAPRVILTKEVAVLQYETLIKFIVRHAFQD